MDRVTAIAVTHSNNLWPSGVSSCESCVFRLRGGCRFTFTQACVKPIAKRPKPQPTPVHSLLKICTRVLFARAIMVETLKAD